MPVEPRPAVRPAEIDEIVEQGAPDTFAADRLIDEEILEIAVLTMILLTGFGRGAV